MPVQFVLKNNWFFLSRTYCILWLQKRKLISFPLSVKYWCYFHVLILCRFIPSIISGYVWTFWHNLRVSILKFTAPTRGPTSTLTTALTQWAGSRRVVVIYVGLFRVVLNSELFWIFVSYSKLLGVMLSSGLFSVLYVGEGKISTDIQMLIIRFEFWSSRLVYIGYTPTILAWTHGFVIQFRLALNRRWTRLFKYSPLH